MSAHDHTTRVPGCFRCELSADEAESAMAMEIEDLEAENERLREALRQIMDGTTDKIAYARAWGALGAEAQP